MPRAAHVFPALLLALAVTACGGDGPTEPPRQKPPPGATVSFTGIDSFTPGTTATLRGTGLDKLTSVTVNGASMAFAASSANQGTFQVPTSLGRACETDGRMVAVAGGGALLDAPLHLSDTVALAVGESRVIDPAGWYAVKHEGRQGYVSATLVEPVSDFKEGLVALYPHPLGTEALAAPDTVR